MRIDQLNEITLARLLVIETDATPRQAAGLLSRPGIGLAVVCHADGAAAGVLSKSDPIRHLADRCLAETTVSTLMSPSIVACGPDDDVHSVWQTMTAQNLQNVPVLGTRSKPSASSISAMR
jgi:CBS domain-containing protein